MKKFSIISCSILYLSGCSGQDWTRPYAGAEDDLKVDKAACMAFSEEAVFDQAGRARVWADEDRVHKCLEDRGWHRSVEASEQ